MKKCCVCRNQIVTEEPAILFIGVAGDNKEICEACEQKMDLLMESDKPDDIVESIDYLYTCLESVNDPEVETYLDNLIENNKSAYEELKRSGPVNWKKKRDYFYDKESEALDNSVGSGWITGMKIFAWITFASIIISGTVVAFQIGFFYNGWIGLVVFIGSIISAFLSVALLMIFLNLAQDISKIKRDVYEIRKPIRK